jgi:hypothetical protein
MTYDSRSQWLCGLRRGSSAARLLGSWVRKKISHRGHGCLSLVSVVCCQVEVFATSWSLVQGSPTDCGVSQMCVTMKPRRNEEAQAIQVCRAIKKKDDLRHSFPNLFLHYPKPLIRKSFFTEFYPFD